MIKERNT